MLLLSVCHYDIPTFPCFNTPPPPSPLAPNIHPFEELIMPVDGGKNVIDIYYFYHSVVSKIIQKYGGGIILKQGSRDGFKLSLEVIG